MLRQIDEEVSEPRDGLDGIFLDWRRIIQDIAAVKRRRRK